MQMALYARKLTVGDLRTGENVRSFNTSNANAPSSTVDGVLRVALSIADDGFSVEYITLV